MDNFIFHNPTTLIFGKGQIATIEFWGIEPNPSIETLRKAIALAKENNIDFLLAVGGGSVLDGTKLIASAIPYQGDAWEIVLKGKADHAIPYASIMTLPATGSEMNSGSVISKLETKEKYAFGTSFPEFSVLDPETTYSLSNYQIACGITDAFIHVCEQYMTTTNQSMIMDRWAEGVLQTLVEIAPKVLSEKRDYKIMSEFMLSATLALNNMIRMGVSQDWATHMIGHELTALHSITHGHTLAIVYPATLRVLKEQKGNKILQYGERIWNITEGNTEERIEKTIVKTEEFFRSLGLKTRLSEMNVGNETIDLIEKRFNKYGVSYGENRNVNGSVAKEILLECV